MHSALTARMTTVSDLFEATYCIFFFFFLKKVARIQQTMQPGDDYTKESHWGCNHCFMW